MDPFWLGLGILFFLPVYVLFFLVALHYWLRWRYIERLARVFQEKPLFIIPRGKKVPEAEDVRVPTTDGLLLHGCYLRGVGPRRGVILFGLEFGSNRWACLPYCSHLLANGYDIFAVETRGQGESPLQPGYEPLHWVTDFEVADMKAALEYLKKRPDADPRGVGLFGISKGGTAGLLAAAGDPYVRCIVTDGIYATYSMMVPYMRKWVGIYNSFYWLHEILPDWYYGLIGKVGLRRVQKQRHCRFAHLEPVLARRHPCPLLMIHGGADTYVKPMICQSLFERARPPKELWLVEGAKHNQSLHVAEEEYHNRVLSFFDQHLAEPANGTAALAPCAVDHEPSKNGCAILLPRSRT